MSSFRRSEPWPCCIRSPTFEETLSTVFIGCWPMRFAASDSGTLSPQPAAISAEPALRLIGLEPAEVLVFDLG